jgi:DNA-binding NarL/FixJ family response regulator
MSTGDQIQRTIILVVDDDAATAAMLADLLESAETTALVALRGERALSIARQITPDLILLDAMMPGMDGFDTCRAFKADEALAHIPVIFMTGLADTDHVVKGFEAGGTDYVTKPIDARQLLARIRTHLANARKAQGAQAALDTTGRYLFAADRGGRLIWWTPQAGRLLSGFVEGGLGVGAALPEALAPLVTASGGGEERHVTLESATRAVGVAVISTLAGGALLMRIVEQVASDREIMLRERLAISDREAQVLNWIAQGKSNRDIADILDISPRTINKHLERIFRKIGVENRTSAAVLALKHLSSQA